MSVRVQHHQGQVTVTFDVTRLDIWNTRQVVPDLERWRVAGRNVRLDLRRIRFVRPFGLVYLYWYIRWLLDLGAYRVLVVLDRENPDICNYLKRMRVPEVFGDGPVSFYPIQNLEIRERDHSRSLVELRTVQVGHGDAVEREAQDITRVLVTRRPDLQPQHEHLQFTIAELLDNTLIHSHTRTAALAVQTYHDQVQVAFGDGGRGIPAALEGHVEAETDADYVARALEARVTSRRDSGGMGLTMLAEVVEEGGGHMGIRSGTGEIVVRRTRQDRHDEVSRLPGTFVEVALAR